MGGKISVGEKISGGKTSGDRTVSFANQNLAVFCAKRMKFFKTVDFNARGYKHYSTTAAL